MPAAVELEHMRSWQVPTAEVTAMVLAVVAAAGGAASSHALAWGITSFFAWRRGSEDFLPAVLLVPPPPTWQLYEEANPTSVLPTSRLGKKGRRAACGRPAA